MDRPGLVRVVSASLLVFSFAWGCGETSDPDPNATSLNPDGAASRDEDCDSCASDGGSDAGPPPDATAPDAAAPDAAAPDATLAEAGTDAPPMPDATSPPDAGHDASSPPDAGADAPPAAPALALLLAKTHLEGAFLTNRSIWADENRIYLASRFSPRLFVLGRNEAANFPILHVVDTSPVMPSSVTGDAGRLYVGMWGPALRVYRTEPAFELERIVDVPGATDLINLQVLGGRLYVSAHQGVFFSVNDPHVYIAALNEGDVVRSFAVDSFAEGLTYGTPAEPFRTAVFDRTSGARITAIDNPLDVLNRPSQVALEADGDDLMMMNPGCCGDGIRLFRTPSVVLERFIPYTWTNAVVRRGHWLLAGTEAGTVALFDLRVHPALKTAELDLRALTGHTGIEDIEIRALLWDGRDGLAFAGSSWGNDQSRGPELPSFFVLRVSGTGS